MTRPQGRVPDLRFLANCLGEPCEALAARLGSAAHDRTLGGVRWILYEREGMTLRARGGSGPEGRLATWTVTLHGGRRTLREAAEPLGLWPACAPDASAEERCLPRLRRALRESPEGPVRSLTATLQQGRITAVTLFDEPPDWE